MNIYECEEKNKIIFPQSFKDILNKAEAQWLDESLEWIFDNEDKLREQIAFGFPSIGDFKLLPFERIEHYIQELNEMMSMDVEYSKTKVRINPEYCLIPFAGMSSGDLYCFFNEMVIVYGHDTGDFDVWANDFEELIFAQLAWEIIDDERDKDSDFIKRHVKLLSDVYVELLETLSKEELEQYVCNIQLPECPEFIV